MVIAMIGNEKVRGDLWFSRLSDSEKERLKMLGEDIFYDLTQGRLHPISGRFPIPDTLVEEAFKDAMSEIKRKEGLEKIRNAIHVCISREDNIDSIVRCMKDEAEADIIPEVIGKIMISTLEEDRMKAQSVDI